ncbi:MAG: phospholipid carrier-dependent glycosyltransferase, partial [Alphaproteobacteria bacterium]
MQGVLGGIETVFLALLGWLEGPAWRRVLFLALVAALTILPGLAALPPTDRDESRFAQASRQMIETGDVVDIRFQDAPRWEKPAGIYWLQAAAALPFGGAEAPIWAYRLPSALAAFLGGLLLMWALGPLIGPGAALLSALMFATSLLVLVEAHLAKTDAVLVATVIAAQGALIRLLAPEAPMRFNWRHLVFWGALGAGLLVKGPVALLPAAGTLLWLAVAGRSIAPLRATRPLPGLLVLLAVAAPWLVAIWIRTDGAFFTDSLLGDMLAKVAQGKERHWGPPGYYLATIWATFWPWAALILLAVPTLWQLR